MTEPLAFNAILDRAYRYRYETYTRLGYPPVTFLVTDEEYVFLEQYSARAREQSDRGEPRVYSSLVIDGPGRSASPPMQIFGMRIIKPERFPWPRDRAFMAHAKPSPVAGEPSAAWRLSRSVPAMWPICRTERPPAGVRDVTCPCGEMIWDLSTCTWPAVPSFNRDIPLAVNDSIAVMRSVQIVADEVGARLATAMGVSSDRLGSEDTRQVPEDLPSSRLGIDDARPRTSSRTWCVPVDESPSDEPLPPLEDLDEGLQCCGQHYPTFAAFMTHRREHGEGRL